VLHAPAKWSHGSVTRWEEKRVGPAGWSWTHEHRRTSIGWGVKMHSGRPWPRLGLINHGGVGRQSVNAHNRPNCTQRLLWARHMVAAIFAWWKRNARWRNCIGSRDARLREVRKRGQSDDARVFGTNEGLPGPGLFNLVLGRHRCIERNMRSLMMVTGCRRLRNETLET